MSRILKLRLSFITATSVVVASSGLRGADSPPRADFTGLWRGVIDQIATPAEFKIDATKSEWRAMISGMTAPVRKSNKTIRVIFPSNLGEFRGRVTEDKIVGHWVQPPSDINPSYVTPIDLTKAGKNVWRGKVQPLDVQLTFWMSIQRTADGSLSAVIRNPEMNLFRRNAYRVSVNDPLLTFSDDKDLSQKFDAHLDSQTRSLTAKLPNVSKTILFRPVEPSEAAGFFARVPRDAKYKYERPRSEDDGWTTASFNDVALNEKPIVELIDKIVAADPTNNPLPIHSLLIARHGKLVLEEYFYGLERDRLHEMQSASKTFAPLLVGIAHEHGAKIDVNTPVFSQFPEYKDFANPDPRKSKVTIRDLMTMTSGLSCDDNDDNSPGNEDVMQEQKAQLDWYKYTLDLPMARDPGGDQAVYCSAGINLLGGIVRNATHTWLPEYFYETVARPLQIKVYHWNLMPTGDGYAGGGLWLRPRDQLKLGQLYLDSGVWNGKRVVSKEWVKKSTSKQSTFGKTLGVDHDYGYGWHLVHFEVAGRGYRAYAAGGNGGQIVMVIPDLDMVVGFTGGAYGEFPKWFKWQSELVPQFIIPMATVDSGS